VYQPRWINKFNSRLPHLTAPGSSKSSEQNKPMGSAGYLGPIRDRRGTQSQTAG
jgi:hypothetical protein